MPESPLSYGIGDATFQAAGGEAGIRGLVDRFFDLMENNPAYREIWSWHPSDHEQSRDKLARFLCGWTGGPRLYREKYGPISIPSAHSHLKVEARHQNQWLACMEEALLGCDYPKQFREYLLAQLAVPAGRIVQVCEQRSAIQ